MSELYSVVVTQRQNQGGNIAVIELAAIAPYSLPKVEAGAHIDIHLPNGLIRQYSLCQDPQHRNFRLGILKDPASRGGSLSAFEDLQTGLELYISAPRNLFPLVSATHHVLIGGGIGITPLITMAYQLFHQQVSFELHYCGQSAAQSAFVEELKTGVLADYTHFHFKDEGANHRQTIPQRLGLADGQSHVYTCGPNGFMDWVIEVAQQQGFAQTQIHQEYFQVDTDLSGDEFEVIAQKSGKTITVHADESILAALDREGISVEMACAQGVCGTCMCDVIEGEPDHRDVYFTDEEKQSNEQILVCCSRSKSARLVLDI
jgi:ferredoxin-NADP reductase